MTTQRVSFVVGVVLTTVVGFYVVMGAWSERSRALAAPPLSLEGLLGDDERLADAPEDGEDELKADNFICLVCHGHFEEEPLVVRHAKEDVGCADCHGESMAHADDEDHIIPPEKMFDPEDVDKMCGECHDMHDAPAHKVIARWQERCPKKTDPKKITCTDCHFEHRMEKRTVWWDRKTRKLVIRKEGQTTKPAEPDDM